MATKKGIGKRLGGISGSDTPTEAPTSAGEFDEIFRRIASSAVVREIWRTAFADEYPEQAGPFSFLTRTELSTVAAALGQNSPQRLVDLGCGCAGPSLLLLAVICEAFLDGIDSSGVAVAIATTAAAQLNMEARARFHVADAAATCLPAAAYTGAVSFDLLQLTPAPSAVIAETARLLRPGGIFAFTTWCLRAPWRNRAVVSDYRPLLEAHGFEVLSYSEPNGWRERQLLVYRLTRERSRELAAEVGSSVANLLVAEAEAAPDALAISSRVIAVARSRPLGRP